MKAGTNEKSLRFELLGLVSKYYPVGLPLSGSSYDGTKLLHKAIGDKIKELSDNGRVEPWSELIDKLFSHFEKENVRDMAYLQYPTLAVSIILKNEQDELFRTRSIELNISLLGPYYTIFLQEQIQANWINKHGSFPGTGIWRGDAASNKESEHFGFIRELVKRHYAEHKLVNHQFLFETKIFGAIPHGEDIETAFVNNPGYCYPLFDFLFQKS